MKQETADGECTPFPPENVPRDTRGLGNPLPQRIATLPANSPLLSVSKRPQSRKMAIKASGKISFVDPAEIVSVRAEGNYVSLEKDSGSYVLRATLSEMINKLESYGFVRIHRSLLVNTLFVEEMQPQPSGNYALRVRGGKVLMTSRTYKKNLTLLAGLWIGAATFVGD